ncbi:Uncharacterised protein [Mycobacteroides abscessus subsp. abscessus]|nr:Uncharacterised protein [Mycobacteroides abscessus subsp. abscessus]
MDLADVDASFVRGAHATISTSEDLAVFLQSSLGFAHRSSLGSPSRGRLRVVRI